MKIVIDINEDVFTRLFDNGTEDYAIVNDDLFAITKAIRNGTPLPRGHGNLIDYDDLIAKLDRYGRKDIKYQLPYSPTIISADKENEYARYRVSN